MTDFFSAVDVYVLLWLILIVVFIVAELISVGLTSIWFAAGALAALIAAIFGGGPALQFLLFLVVSCGLLAATRPWAKKFINAHTQRTNADRLVGEEIRIAEQVSNMDQTGSAIVHGQEWMVRAEDDRETFGQGEPARVVRISGVKLIVEKIKEE